MQIWKEEFLSSFSDSKTRYYESVLNNHLIPYFGDLPFSEFKKIRLKKFLSTLNNRQNRYGDNISAKTIRNILTPLRVIYFDAMDEYDWTGLGDPFRDLKLPQKKKIHIQPFSYHEWILIMENMVPWYRPYFEFAVQTGMRPSEQVALTWSSIDDRSIYIERSRVRNIEKDELKTKGSEREIELRPNLLAILEKQRELTNDFDDPHIFLNMEGRPIRQENLGRVFKRAVKRAGVRVRRMYEIRHTFASWALAAGESPGWVAKTLGHTEYLDGL